MRMDAHGSNKIGCLFPLYFIADHAFPAYKVPQMVAYLKAPACIVKIVKCCRRQNRNPAPLLAGVLKGRFALCAPACAFSVLSVARCAFFELPVPTCAFSVLPVIMYSWLGSHLGELRVRLGEAHGGYLAHGRTLGDPCFTQNDKSVSKEALPE
eukprot:1157398-Pelagomonas_calceolata.AAC.1